MKYVIGLMSLFIAPAVFASGACQPIIQILGDIGSSGSSSQSPGSDADYFYSTCTLISNKPIPKNASVVFTFNNYTETLTSSPFSVFKTPAIGFLPGMRSGVSFTSKAVGFNAKGYTYACQVFYCRKQS